MGENLMLSRMVLAASALALGTALTAIPALAQNNSAQQYKYPMGRPMNDGGYVVQQDSGAQQTGSAESRGRGGLHPSIAATGQNTAQNYHYPMGRPMNDGGFPAEQAQYNGGQRGARTGSAENTEHAEARSAALGGRNHRGPYYDRFERR
jgi:hypothetical protein